MRARDRSTTRASRTNAVATNDDDARIKSAGVIMPAITLWAADKVYASMSTPIAS